jgi:hypothetical protein
LEEEALAQLQRTAKRIHGECCCTSAGTGHPGRRYGSVQTIPAVKLVQFVIPAEYAGPAAAFRPEVLILWARKTLAGELRESRQYGM